MLNIGDKVEYQDKMYTIDDVRDNTYHLAGTHMMFYIKRRHLRKYPLRGLSGTPLREALQQEPPTYADAVKRICQAGLTMADITLIAKSATP